MAMPCVHLLILFALLCFVTASNASPHSLRQSPADMAMLGAAAPSPADASQPTTYFEGDRPFRPPPGSSGPCSTLLLSHSFGFTFTKPPATAAYSPPRCLVAAGGTAAAISLAVLEWRATCQGVQYDRIFGVELLRSCTAEPRPNGIVWSISKDITKYATLLAAGNSTLAVYLSNLVDNQFTGVYHANLTLHLYFRPTPTRPPPAMPPADFIVPISRSLPLNDGLWYQIQNATDVESTSVKLPSNTYRAVLEVYVSFHGDDEFWYTNTPGMNGPFREVTVHVDEVVAGAVWPFAVIYTGGIHPLLWQPITAIGSFNLPSYYIELTPFLGWESCWTERRAHEFGFAVTNALHMWYVDANLHLWLDPGSTATTGGLFSYDAAELAANTTSSHPGGPGNIEYHTTATRHISAIGWVKSSYGNITTIATQTFAFENTNAFNDGSSQAVNQTTVAHAGVYARDDHAGVLYSFQARRNFPLFVDLQPEQVSVTHGMEESNIAADRWSGARHWSLRTMQDSVVDFEERDGKLVGMSWGSRQTYRYEATEGCYFRNVTSSGHGIASDQSNEVCNSA